MCDPINRCKRSKNPQIISGATLTRHNINAIRTNKQNSKYAQHILETGHNNDTMDQIMTVLQVEKKGQKLNTLGRFHVYEMTRKSLQMNDTFTDIHNPIFYILIKTHKKPLPPPPTKH
jgi:hypothetical protein